MMKIGFFGAGKAGRSLGLYFHAHGVPVVGYASRTFAHAQQAAAALSATAFSNLEALAAASDTVLLTTTDDALVAADRQAAELLPCHPDWKGKVWLHASGACPSARLAQLLAAGCPVGSMHPLLSFGDSQAGALLLENAFFTLEGTPAARTAMQTLLNTAGAHWGVISAQRKALYHAGACVLSNYLVTLLHSGLTLLEAAGLEPGAALHAAEPLVSGTVENVWRMGTRQALTGPISRGDAGTVAAHLAALTALPQEAELYGALGLKTVDFIQEKIGEEKADELRKILEGRGSNA